MANNLNAFKVPLSGNSSIDGLLWYEHLPYSAEYPFKNYINYSFDPSLITDPATQNGAAALTDTAKQGVRNALSYVSSVTGITFNEVATGAPADTDLVFAKAPLDGSVTSSDTYTYNFNPGSSQALDISDDIIINSNKTGADSLPPNTWAYQGLLQAIGEAVGLRVPDSNGGSFNQLPGELNNGSATLMAANNTITYNSFTSLYQGALNWLYSSQGLKNPGIIPTGGASSGTIRMINQNSSDGTIVSS